MEIVKSELKRKQGRPPVYTSGEPMVRGSFRIPLCTLEALKEVSGGNVTRAIIELVDKWEEERITHPTPYATIQYSASSNTGVPPVTSTQR